MRETVKAISVEASISVDTPIAVSGEMMAVHSEGGRYWHIDDGKR